MVEGNALKGVALIAAASMAFALSDVATKLLVQHYPVPLVVAVRYAINLLLLIAILAPKQGMGLVRTRRTGLVIFRALCLAVASLGLGLALRMMPVAETAAIVHLQPIGVLLLAGPILGEKVGLPGWIATAFGFLGVMLIVRPGADLAPAGVLLAGMAAAVSVAYQLLSRVLAKSESTMAMLFYTALVGTIVFAAMLPWNWRGPVPGATEVLLFLGLGALATVGHFLFTAAFREAPASLLAPVIYLHLVWAGGFGWLFFNHLPDGISIIGLALVAMSGVAIAFRSRKAT